MYNFEQSHFLLHISPTNGQCSTSMCVYTFVSEFYSVALYRSILQDMYWSEATRLTFGRIWTWFLYSFSKNMLASNGLYIYIDIYIYVCFPVKRCICLYFLKDRPYFLCTFTSAFQNGSVEFLFAHRGSQAPRSWVWRREDVQSLAAHVWVFNGCVFFYD